MAHCEAHYIQKVGPENVVNIGFVYNVHLAVLKFMAVSLALLDQHCYFTVNCKMLDLHCDRDW